METIKLQTIPYRIELTEPSLFLEDLNGNPLEYLEGEKFLCCKITHSRSSSLDILIFNYDRCFITHVNFMRSWFVVIKKAIHWKNKLKKSMQNYPEYNFLI